MMIELTVNPAKIRQFGEPAGAAFCLITNQRLREHIDIVNDGTYSRYEVIDFDRDFGHLLRDTIPERAHILVMSPDRFFESPDEELLGPERKLLAMACNSTPTDTASLRHFLRCIEATDPLAQEKFAEDFFGIAEHGDALIYTDAEYATTATLRLFDRELVWNQQAGLVDWGEQQIVPSGEISVLPIEITEFDVDQNLPLDGEIVFRGYPILHSGTPSFSLRDQRRIYGRLSSLRSHAVKASVEEGTITDITPLSEGSQDIATMLETMFEVDSRYRKVWEIGHALNTTHELLPGNHAMNEVYGGSDAYIGELDSHHTPSIILT